MLIYWFIAFFILTLGTRLYFLSSLITIFAMYYTIRKQIKVIHFFFIIFFFALIFSMIGVLRQGGTLRSDRIVFIFFGEPFFTGYSLFSFLKLNDLPWLNMPNGLMVDVINLLPTVLMPDKGELMKTLYVSNYEYVSPLGAKNVFVSLMENFGILGSFVFIVFLAFIVAMLYKKLRYSFFIIIGVLCFSFFRDPFSVSIIKYIFQISLIGPIYYFCVNKFLRYSINKVE
jgi:hypothetical protein